MDGAGTSSTTRPTHPKDACHLPSDSDTDRGSGVASEQASHSFVRDPTLPGETAKALTSLMSDEQRGDILREQNGLASPRPPVGNHTLGGTCQSARAPGGISGPLELLAERLVADAIRCTQHPQGLPLLYLCSDAGQMTSEPVPSPLAQQHGFVDWEIPLLGHAASFPVEVARPVTHLPCSSRATVPLHAEEPFQHRSLHMSSRTDLTAGLQKSSSRSGC